MDQRQDLAFIRPSYKTASKLPDHTSIFTAETMALIQAVEDSLRSDLENVIFTDSASVLSALEHRSCKNPNIQKLNQLTSPHINQDQQLTICWIPGHTGIKSNEIADRLANKGRRKTSTFNTLLLKRDVIILINGVIRESWEKEWLNTRNNFLRLVKTTTTSWPSVVKNRDQKILTRVRIGHTRLTHSHLMERSSPPLCQFCGNDITIFHLLTECHGYTLLRNNCSLDFNIDSILSAHPQKQENLLC